MVLNSTLLDNAARVERYYDRSRPSYNFFLGGSQHFGFHPLSAKISEKDAQNVMHDKVAEKIGLAEAGSIDMRVLDAGSGQGVATTYLARSYSCYIDGVTVVRAEVDISRKRAEREGVADKARFHFMNYSATGFPDETFDAVFTLETLTHSPDVLTTLREFYRVLKSGGRLALFEYTISEDGFFSDQEMMILEMITAASAGEGFRQFRHDSFAGTITEASFRDVHAEDITQNIEPSFRRLRNISWLPYQWSKLRGTQHMHPNRTSAVEGYKMGKKGLIKYQIFTAVK